MQLRFINAEGRQAEFELGPKPITVGRGEDADVQIPDEKASRLHCEIRLWNGDYIVKDLKSRNGTYVNGQRIDVAELHFGDSLRVGSTVFHAEKRASKGTTTIIGEVGKEMDKGKGYRTMLREIVKSAEDVKTPHKPPL